MGATTARLTRKSAPGCGQNYRAREGLGNRAPGALLQGQADIDQLPVESFAAQHEYHRIPFRIGYGRRETRQGRVMVLSLLQGR